MNFANVFIERADGRLLFQLRDKKGNISNPGRWGLFGGRIEKGETPYEAAVRELREELTIRIKEEELKLMCALPSSGGRVYMFRLILKEHHGRLRLREGTRMEFMSFWVILTRQNVIPLLRFYMLLYPLMSILR